MYAEKPQKDIYSFIGKVTNHAASADSLEEPLGVENTIWANTVVASGTALGLVIYSGPECRAIMNNSAPRSKVCLIGPQLLVEKWYQCLVYLFPQRYLRRSACSTWS